MAARRGAAAAAQHELPAHELAIIFADRALGGPEAGIGAIGAAGPFPDIAEKGGAGGGGTRLDRAGGVELVARTRIVRGGGGFPFGLGRQARAGLAGIGVGLEEADMRHGRGGIDRAAAIESEAGPTAA